MALALTGKKRNLITGKCKIELTKCKVCQKPYYVNSIKWGRVTCSRRCATIAITKFRTYQNGSRKAEWFYNPFEGKDVLLESSWEVRIANLLIAKNIVWVRPDPIDWVDHAGITRLYYPDFYLSDFKLYLDPKNPYCMKQDEYKMSVVSKIIHLEFGDISKIINIIENL